MTYKEAKKLKKGDTVVFSDGVKGVINQVGYAGTRIQWVDGQVGHINFHDFQDVSQETKS